MKIILSRKGLDSSFGGGPSVVLPNGYIVSAPIPGDQDEIPYSQVYSGFQRQSVYDILSSVSSTVLYNGERKKWDMDTRCHLDPDLAWSSYPRSLNWRGAFGQADAAQSVLEHAHIEPEDIFLFFGWFQQTEYKDGKLRLCKGGGFHMIYGYLEIGQIFYTSKNKGKYPEWLMYHPHMLPRRIDKPSNCIYIGTQQASWNRDIPGFGVFTDFDPELVLTAPGMSRSKWHLPSEFRGLKITYHDPEKSWRKDYFQSACRGQEFVFEENSDVEIWAKHIIEKHIDIKKG